MPKESGIHQKLKLLYLAKIFMEETDDNHPLSVYELSDMLEEMGVNAGRKTLASDIDLLKDFGLDILDVPVGKAKGYFLASREFEQMELKLLADAVSSSRFITEKKSRQLLKKIEKLAGRYDGLEINRSVYIANRVKSENELIYITVDSIVRAMNEGVKIRFGYFDYDVNKKKRVREGERICSPYALTWNDGNYYLIGYYDKRSVLTNFRVDRMENVELLEEKAVPIPEGFDLVRYMNTTFSMFSGTEYNVRLRFDSSLVNAVIDKFGTDIILVPDGKDSFEVNARIKTGYAFYGWMFQFGQKAEIISPSNIREEYIEMLEDVVGIYKEGQSHK